MKKINNWGFTLIELIVVITIIAILATLSFIAYSSYIKESHDTVRKVAVNEIARSVLQYDVKSSLKPKALGLVKVFDQYPIDPVNFLGYQYNVNSSEAPTWSKTLWWKWFVVCTNRPLEKFSDDNGNLLPDYLSWLDENRNRKDFIEGKLQNRIGKNYEDIGFNVPMWYYCEGTTTSFNSLVSWGGNDSIGTANCSTTLLDSSKKGEDLGKACKIIFNDTRDNQAVWPSPTAWTPFTIEK